MAENITFLQINPDIRVPGTRVEIDNTDAIPGLLALRQRMILIGQRLSTGTVAEKVLTPVRSKEEGEVFFGTGSMLARMVEKALKANNKTELYCVSLDDHASGVLATGEIAVTGSVSKKGAVYLYIAGRRFIVPVFKNDTNSEVGDAIEAAINEDVTLPVTASNAAGDVTITARNDGTLGNGVDMRENMNIGDETAAGISIAITPMASGLNDPDIQDALDTIGEESFRYLGHPYSDAANMVILEDWLDDRWDGMVMNYTLAFSAHSDTLANLTTYGNLRNNPWSSVMGLYKVPTPAEEFAAIYMATEARELNLDPSRPNQTVELEGVVPPVHADRFIETERETLLHDGIATFVVESDRAFIERDITTYQKNAGGAPDVSYLDINTGATLAAISEQWLFRVKSKYPRHKLADDTARVIANVPIVRPIDLKTELIAIMGEFEDKGWVENVAGQFVDEVVAIRNAEDRNRVDMMGPPDLVNQLRVLAMKLKYKL